MLADLDAFLNATEAQRMVFKEGATSTMNSKENGGENAQDCYPVSTTWYFKLLVKPMGDLASQSR